ncbi:MAG: hypothetical protein WCX32_01550 [Clostridia bacterium]|jgi:predicted RNA-binding Zn-ribbon protein involved in translation (DUF1610 family)|nr:hypothetical protein [Clostridia bacterium]MDD4276171.1 hypothetical protein [Clostridia bacterium]
MLGITEKDDVITCATCGMLISDNGEYDQKYCVNCGNPLTYEAIQEHEEFVQNIKNDTVKEVADKLSKNSEIKEMVLKMLTE